MRKPFFHIKLSPTKTGPFRGPDCEGTYAKEGNENRKTGHRSDGKKKGTE